MTTKMQQFTIIGTKTLLGRHLIATINKISPGIKQKHWNYNDDLRGLDEALEGSDTVFNFHEVQDFSLLPDVNRMRENNVDFVSQLISKCISHGCTLLVHLSSVYLQCSIKWPNVYGREAENYEKTYRAECPYPEYCESKFEAERLVAGTGGIARLVVRVGPLYGEWDDHSLVCDSILAKKTFGCIPRIGWNQEDLGVLQFTYARNVAHALIACADKLLAMTMAPAAAVEQQQPDGSEAAAPLETVIICDQTPVRNVYSLLEEMMEFQKTEKMQEGEGKEEEDSGEGGGSKTRHHKLFSGWRIPFTLFYALYWFFCLLVSALNRVFGYQNPKLKQLPSPNYAYLLLRHWTFYSDYKLRLFFDFKPPYDWEASMRRSLAYYARPKSEQIRGVSWLPPPADDEKTT